MSKNDQSRWFVTATGTEVGKTVVCAALAHGLRQLGLHPGYQKLIQAGTLEEDRQTFSRICPDVKVYNNLLTLVEPASPDQSKYFDKQPERWICAKDLEPEPHPAGPLIMEGAGGLLVPLSPSNETWIDFLDTRTDAQPFFLVSSSQLGTLNHTGLSLEVLKHSGHEPTAVILSGPPHPANLSSLKRLHPQISFIEFPQLDGLSEHPEWNQRCLQLAKEVTSLIEQKRPKPSINPQHVWQPYTQHQNCPEPLAITHAQGVWLHDQQGQRYIDGISSWWVNTIGHGHPRIAKAIAQAQKQLDHVIFAGAVHQPACQLAEEIIDFAATGTHRFDRVFYTDNGSCAVEVAMKMAMQSFYNRGEQRSRFLCLHGGYHGDTLGTMSLGDCDGFHGAFKELLFENDYIHPVTSHSHTFCSDPSQALPAALIEIDNYFEKNHTQLAGVMVEPLVQGAGGMIMHQKPWLERLVKKAQSYGIPVIFDEVFTGMGRIGKPFAFHYLDCQPDILCLAKGLTGGNLPLALTIASEDIFNAFLSDDRKKALYHGHSYTANAIACQAALATLEIYRSENLVAAAQRIEATFKKYLSTHTEALNLQNPRVMGAIMAFELPGTEGSDYFHSRNFTITLKAREKGLFIRPLGNTVYLVPPLTITASELDHALKALSYAVAE